MDTPREDRLERLRDSTQIWLGALDPTLEPGALIETAFLMACADGELSAVEYEQLVATIEYITQQQFAPNQLRTMIDQLLAALHTDGWEARIAAIAGNLSDPIARRNAYSLAAGVSFIDGEVQPSEQQLFGLLATAFEIPTDEASTILVRVRDELFGVPSDAHPAV